MKRKEAEKLVEGFNELAVLDTAVNRANAKASKGVKTPRMLSHCAGMIHLSGILNDMRFGGREVLSGNVYGTFDKTNFSPVPMIAYPNYSGCIVVNAEKVEKKNAKKFRPTLYDANGKCAYFGDGGWAIAEGKTPRDEDCNAFFIEEKEWRMENPIEFGLDDVEAVLIHEGRSNEESIQNYVLKKLAMGGLTSEQIQLEASKFHFIGVDDAAEGGKPRKIRYSKPMFGEVEIETVLACDKSSNVMLNQKKNILDLMVSGGKKIRRSVGMVGEDCRLAEKGKNTKLT